MSSSNTIPNLGAVRPLKLDASGQDWVARILLLLTALFLIIFKFSYADMLNLLLTLGRDA